MSAKSDPTLPPVRVPDDRISSDRHLTLTLLWHPDVRRTGQRSRAPGSPTPWRVTRLEPEFSFDGHHAGPLEEAHLSRHKGLLIEQGPPVKVRAAPGLQWQCDGRQVEEVELDDERLEHGVVIVLARTVVLLLHWTSDVVTLESTDEIVGDSGPVHRLRRQIGRLAPAEDTVLIEGETGTGKELIARALHRNSPRRAGPFETMSMGAVGAGTCLNDLFGHADGAFTGSGRASPGAFGRADGGTLFLDELGDAPEEVQSALLRVLERKEIQPVGGKARKVDVRIVAATEIDLDARVSSGHFRAALLHRVRVGRIVSPPLRHRRDDIPLLIRAFLDRRLPDWATRRSPDGFPWMSAGLVANLVQRRWDGNVRELLHIIDRICLEQADEPMARVPEHDRMLPGIAASIYGARPDEALPAPYHTPLVRATSPDDAEIERVLVLNDYAIDKTVKPLRISKTTLYEAMKRLRIPIGSELNASEIEGALVEAGGDAVLAARRLRVSHRAFQQRRRSLLEER